LLWQQPPPKQQQHQQQQTNIFRHAVLSSNADAAVEHPRARGSPRSCRCPLAVLLLWRFAVLREETNAFAKSKRGKLRRFKHM
jgi:hypothetical protein